MYKCKYFSIKELVSPAVYNKYGDFAWRFFDEQTLKDLDTIRKEYNSSIIINDWVWGGQFKESGLRSNADSIVKTKTEPYLSGHVLAKAFDLKDSKVLSHNMSWQKKLETNKKLYSLVWGLMKQGKLKSFQRMEHIRHTATWVHVDALRAGKPTIFKL